MVIGVVALILVVFWVFKIRNIQRLRVEIVQLETKLSKGQEIWRDYPPLTPEERRDLQKAQERLFRMLPRDKDIPPLLQEVSRLAREYNLADVSFHTGDGAALSDKGQQPASAASQVAAVPQPTPAVAPNVQESSGPIASFPLKVTFAGDYRKVAYFLEALQKIPRLMTIQSLQLQRGIPLVVAEVVLKAYYYRGDLSVKVK
ncbi:MAG: type 4a pilus biogenesis protein PilO [Candidatus Binatia bacterium]